VGDILRRLMHEIETKIARVEVKVRS